MIRATSEADLQAWLHKTLPLYAYVGLSVDSWGDVLQCSVRLTENNRNHLGAVHAAVVWAVAETLGGIAYFAHVDELGKCFIAVREVTINFQKPARSDIRAKARFGAKELAQVQAQLDEAGKSEYDVDITVLDADDATVATARGRYYLRREIVQQPTASEALA